MGNSRQKKSSGFFSLLISAFKPRRSWGGNDSVVEEPGSARRAYPSYSDNEPGSARIKVYPSDYDKIYGIVGDPKVDSRAEDFIKRVHKNHIMASGSQTMGELQTVTVYPANN